MVSYNKVLLIYFLICGFANSFCAASTAVMPGLFQEKNFFSDYDASPDQCNKLVVQFNNAQTLEGFHKFNRRIEQMADKFNGLVVQFNNAQTLEEFHTFNLLIERMAGQLDRKFMRSFFKGTKQIYRDYWRKIDNPPAK